MPVSTLGDEYFRHDEAARALVGEDSGTRYAIGDTLDLRLGEANPLTGALKFELPGAPAGRIEPRGTRAAPGRRPGGQGKRDAGHGPGEVRRQGRRGRPANIRHQGKPKGGKGPRKG